MTLSREQILAAADVQSEEVAVPEWGGSVIVRGMSGTERDAFEASILTVDGKTAKTDLTNFRAKLLAHSLVDEKGALLFTPADIEALGKKSAAALDRLAIVAKRLSALTDADEAELTKN